MSFHMSWSRTRPAWCGSVVLILVTLANAFPRCASVAYACDEIEPPEPAGQLFLNVFRAVTKGDATTIAGLGMLDLDSGKWSRFYDEPLPGARLSPDSRSIAYGSINGDGIFILDASRHPKPKRTIAFSGPLYGTGPLFWSSDGRNLLCVQDPLPPRVPSRRRTVIVDINDRTIRTLPLPEAAIVQDWSPDGRNVLIAALDVPEKAAERWRPCPLDIVGIDGTGRRRILDDSVPRRARFDECQFSPDGRRVFYIKSDLVRKSRTLWTVDLDGIGPHCIIPEQAEQVDEFRVSPDGKFFAVRLARLVRPENGPRANPIAISRLAIFDAKGELRKSIAFRSDGFVILGWRSGELPSMRGF